METLNEPVEIWAWLLQLVQRLGEDGMSSEETVTEDESNHVFHVKTLPWRRNIDKELRIVDSARIQDPPRFGHSGSRPVLRRRGNDLISVRDPVHWLPKVLYDAGWFAREGHRRLGVQVSRAPFPWMEIVVRRTDDDEGGQR